MVSYASDVKKELTSLPVHPEHAKAELAAFLRMNGVLSLHDHQFSLDITTENPAIARRIFSLIKTAYGIEPLLIVSKKMKLKKNYQYLVRLQKQVHEILSDLEIFENHNNDLLKLMNSFFYLNAKATKRRNGYIVYLKEAEKIGDFLHIVGAVNAMLAFEDLRIMRDMRNSVNRLVNCDTANLKKTANAAAKQVEDIQLIEKKVGLSCSSSTRWSNFKVRS